MGRVYAPLDTSCARQLRIQSAMACDPMKAQYKRASIENDVVAESIGQFTAKDGEFGTWPFTIQQKSIMEEITTKMTPDWVQTVLIPMIDMSDKRVEPSLRLIDWFVTNYAKSHGITINDCDIHVSYIDTRRAYQCRNFDPFRRNLKLSFSAEDGTAHTTTVGQLNFLLWAHNTGVLEYVRAHREGIDKDMCGVCKKMRQQRQKCKEDGVKRKRTALSVNRGIKCRISRPSATGICYAGRNIKV